MFSFRTSFQYQVSNTFTDFHKFYGQGPIIQTLFFIIGPCNLNVLQVIYHSTYIFYEHITYTTFNIRIGMSDPSVAYPHELMMMMICRCPNDEAAVL
jgi:hypothetical protein